jgi:carbamoyl-phosphate synthase small subunit
MSPLWNWREMRERPAYLALADGSVWRGTSAGAPVDALGEVVFNTGMTGYQEILSDPSYSGQFVVMTAPEIGNTGVNDADMESRRFFASGFVAREMRRPSNWRSLSTLPDALARQGVPALSGIDTRALTVLLRDGGTQKGFLCATGAVPPEEGVARARAWEGLDGQDYASRVSCDAAYPWDPDDALTVGFGIGELPPADLSVVAYDFGIKWNILRGLRRRGMRVTVVPARATAADVLALKPDGVFLSNGPADPAAVTYAIDAARGLIGRVPVMGICLGHQILGLACGGRTFRLPFGHHGCNHPVKELATGAVEITSQNHNFSVDPGSLDPAVVEITHLNLNDGTVEGLRHRTEPMFSVQYHPEAGPGPHDSDYLFGRFRDLILHPRP